MHLIPALDFGIKASALLELAIVVLERGRQSLDVIAQVPLSSCSFENVVWPLNNIEADIWDNLGPSLFLRNVSPDAHVRCASGDANNLVDKFFIDMGTREDIFLLTQCVFEKEEEMNRLDEESKRLVNRLMLEFKRHGLLLNASDRELLKGKKKELGELSTQFDKNLRDDQSSLLLSKEELEGCKDDFFQDRKQQDGKYIVTTGFADVDRIMRFAKRSETRMKMEKMFNTRAPMNVHLIQRAVELRREIAKLLGYTSHAELVLADRLARKPETVMDFLNDLKNRLTPKAEEELAGLLRKKEANGGESIIHSFDIGYYSRLIMEDEYSINQEKISEYFQVEHVVSSMLGIYAKILGVIFTKVDHGPIWHGDVQLYQVNDVASQSLLGHIYLDLFPREGKTTQAACLRIRPGFQRALDEREGRQTPIVAMVASLSKADASKPRLLQFREVTTLFHELGHAMHHMCAQTRYIKFAGTAVERDFVEAPSQMLENWIWDQDILALLSRHYERIEESLPEELIKKMIEAKNFNIGLNNLRQILYAIFDMTIHMWEVPRGEGDKALDGLFARLYEEIMLIPRQDGLSPASSFLHIMKGYDAGYYSYPWSEVFSADMFFTRFEQEGLLDEHVGMDYRMKILAPGGSKDGMDMLTSFLGRPPNSDAFFRKLFNN